jgi:hypothetical protein
MSTPVVDSYGYPVDSNGFVRQCAWCRRVADSDGQFRLASPTLVRNASHGCCAVCEVRFFDLRRFRPT